MRKSLLAAAAFSFALATGAAYAQSGEGEPGGQPPVIQNQPAGLENFHTDDTMTELRGADENRDVFMAMPMDEQQALRDQCEMHAAADPSVEVGDEVTGSIEPGTLPPTITALCQQMSTWQ